MKPLTGRELECLYWASLGKTSWEIGSILGITERTTNFHITNACAKLEVKGRQAAITAAYQSGLLSSDMPPSDLELKSPETVWQPLAGIREPAP